MAQIKQIKTRDQNTNYDDVENSKFELCYSFTALNYTQNDYRVAGLKIRFSVT